MHKIAFLVGTSVLQSSTPVKHYDHASQSQLLNNNEAAQSSSAAAASASATSSPSTVMQFDFKETPNKKKQQQQQQTAAIDPITGQPIPQQAAAVKVHEAQKSLRTIVMEAILDYCRLVYDVYSSSNSSSGNSNIVEDEDAEDLLRQSSSSTSSSVATSVMMGDTMLNGASPIIINEWHAAQQQSFQYVSLFFNKIEISKLCFLFYFSLTI